MRAGPRRERGLPGAGALSLVPPAVAGVRWRGGAVSGVVAVAAGLAGLPAGCAVPHASLTAPFVAAEHERCAGAGRGSLAGRLVVRGEDGEAVPVAGGDVTLWPASAYSRAVAADLAAGGRPRPEGLLAPYARPARTDDRGGFRLDRLPPCRYVVLARVPGSLARGRLLGGYAAAEVAVGEGEAASVALGWPPAEPFRAPEGAEPPAAKAPSLPSSAPSLARPAAARRADPCAPYARDPVQRLRCAWVTGPERDRFVPPAGRGASLRTRMDCIPDRDDPGRYAACVASDARQGRK